MSIITWNAFIRVPNFSLNKLYFWRPYTIRNDLAHSSMMYISVNPVSSVNCSRMKKSK